MSVRSWRFVWSCVALPLLGCGGPASGAPGTGTAGSESTGTTAGTGTTGSGQGTAATGEMDDLRLEDVRVEPNPNSVLSCIVSWRTNVPATGRVLHGETSDYTRQVSAPTEGDDQRVVVIGLHAEQTAYLEVEARTADGRRARSEPLTFVAGALPPEVPRPELRVSEPTLVDDGWILTNVWTQGEPPVAAMYDRAGQPVWYAIHPYGPDPRGDVDATWRPDTRTVVTGATGGLRAAEVDLEGEVVWLGPEQPAGVNAAGQFHHHLQPLSGGGLVTLAYDVRGVMQGDRILEIDREGAELWSWSTIEELHGPGVGDFTHGNAAWTDEDADATFYSARNLSSIFKIARADGSVVWRLGEGGDFGPDPESDFPWPIQQHSPIHLGGGRLLMYDNGDEARGFSRLLEYELDEAGMVANIAWEYRGEEPWFTDFWGDADRLPNGNTLAVAGTNGGGGVASRIFEVTADGGLAWEIAFPTGDPFGVGNYRAQHLDDPREPIAPDGG